MVLDTKIGRNGQLDSDQKAGQLPAVDDTRWDLFPSGLTRKSRAGDVVAARLREQVGAFIDQEAALRGGASEGIHKMRVASRRLRSALKTFSPLFETDATTSVNDELQWFAGVLGRARDIEVLRHRVEKHLQGLPAEQILGPVQIRVEHRLGADYGEAREAALAGLDGRRYSSLLAGLVALAADPPFSHLADRPAQKVLAPLVGRETKRLSRRVRAAFDEARPAHRDIAFHQARKSAKRARYAAETVQPVFGCKAERCAKAMEKIQETLGDRHDAVVATAFLRQEGARAAALAGEDGYTFGFLNAVEAIRILADETRFADDWRHIQGRRSPRRFLA